MLPPLSESSRIRARPPHLAPAGCRPATHPVSPPGDTLHEETRGGFANCSFSVVTPRYQESGGRQIPKIGYSAKHRAFWGKKYHARKVSFGGRLHHRRTAVGLPSIAARCASAKLPRRTPAAASSAAAAARIALRPSLSPGAAPHPRSHAASLPCPPCHCCAH